MEKNQLTRIHRTDRKKLKILAAMAGTTCPKMLHRLIRDQLSRQGLIIGADMLKDRDL